MAMELTMPRPLGCMLEYLDIDIERSIKLMPNEMQAATERCRQCDKYNACDFNVESRYFLCPNRGLLDQLEEMLA
jgi:hypothetical protein